MVDDEPTTLKEWLTNNRQIAEGEHLSEDEVENNQVETIRYWAEKAVSAEWAKNMNEEYGPFDDRPEASIRAYTAEDMFDPEVIAGEVQRRKESGEDTSIVSARDLSNRAPLTTDFVQFVLWLHEKGIIEQQHEWSDEVLARLALEYTGE